MSRTASIPLRRAALLCLLAAPLACHRVPRAERVVLRLGPEDFAVGQPRAHVPVAAIGDQAREVVIDRDPIAVAKLTGVRFERGTARVDITLPEATVGFPDSAFVLAAQRLPSAVPDRLAMGLAQGLHFTQALRFVVLDAGWRLERDPAASASAALRIDSQTGDDSVLYNVRLEAYRPMPGQLVSREFSLPAGSRIELGYGLANPARASTAAIVRFAAALECADTPAREVFAATVDARNPEDLGWHDASVEVAQAAPACRLRLQATSRGTDAGAPLWAVPRVVSAPRRERGSRPTSVVLISLDTLRGDHLSSNGYGRATSPEIDRLLVARGSSFADVSTTYPMTNYAHLGMFTGLYPAALPRNGTLPPDAPVRMLAEVLHDAGFETTAFTEDALVGGVYGFWFGFDRFTERTVEPRDRGGLTFADGIRYAREHRDRRFFLWLHTYKNHDPYTAGERYRSLFVSSQATDGPGAEPVGAEVPARYRSDLDEYDRTIREADDLVAGLVEELERLGLMERTLVVLVSDHGEAFGEHGLPGHCFHAYQEALTVPLVLRGPGIPAGRRVSAPVSLVDLVPTLLDLLGLPALPQTQGISLVPALRGVPIPEDRPLYFEWVAGDALGVRFGPWKFFGRVDSGALFNLAADPRERRAVAGAPEARRTAATQLAAYDADCASRRALASSGSAPAAEPPAISDRAEKSLRALGYVE